MIELPKTDTVWQHSTGRYYKILLLTNTEADPGRELDHPVNVVYIGINGKIWSKTLENFLNKMTAVSPSVEDYFEIDFSLNDAISRSLFAVNYTLKQANSVVTENVKKDKDLAWAWHCVLACAAQDEGVSHEVSNKAAARAMRSIFDVDTYPLIEQRTVSSEGTDA
jgi:hypothetical protein